METLLRNSSYIFLFLRVLPCKRNRNTTSSDHHLDPVLNQLVAEQFHYAAKYCCHCWIGSVSNRILQCLLFFFSPTFIAEGLTKA